MSVYSPQTGIASGSNKDVNGYNFCCAVKQEMVRMLGEMHVQKLRSVTNKGDFYLLSRTKNFCCSVALLDFVTVLICSIC